MVLGVSVLITSCKEIRLGNSFLEKPPSVDVTLDTIFSNLEFAQRFLAGAYTTLPYGLPKNWEDSNMNLDFLECLTDINQSDLTWSAGRDLYYSGKYTAAEENSNIGTKYAFVLKKNNWIGIRMSHIFIKNIDRVPGTDEATKKRLKAEARMVIAVHYSDMFRHFGGVPWVDHAYDVNEDTNLPRLTSRATLDSIVALIDRAAPDLPWVVANPGNDDGRFTQAAALGLKARILLFGASPLFNSSEPYLDGQAAQENLVWHGRYDAGLWEKAAAASKELIEKVHANGGYQLVRTGDYRQDFQDAYFARGNGELLISTRIMYKPASFWDANYLFYQSAGYYGTAGPTADYVNLFPMANGLPITDPASGYDPGNPFKDRDPRLYETVLVNGDYFQGRKAELWVGGLDRPTLDATNVATGFGLRKFVLEHDPATSGGATTQWPYLRLAEIYLSYAEALNEINGGPTEEAYRWVNEVRSRVGLSDLRKGLSQKEFREALLTERACEFGYEEVRWFDLIRWKRAEDFTKTLHGLNIHKSGDNLTYTSFDLPVRHWKTSWSPKWYLSAFPPDEINKGYGLIQNPGWE